LITIELSSVWFAGSASLYSKEFYDLLRARLTESGVLQQWVQLHHIRKQELAVIMRTLRATFPHVALFVGGSQGILVASAKPLSASKARLEKLEEIAGVKATLNGQHLVDLFDELVMSEGDLDRYCEDAEREGGGPILSTDDNLYLEYATPKGNVMAYDASLKAALAELDRYHTKDVRARHLGP
jgi:spermidine synthase